MVRPGDQWYGLGTSGKVWGSGMRPNGLVMNTSTCIHEVMCSRSLPGYIDQSGKIGLCLTDFMIIHQMCVDMCVLNDYVWCPLTYVQHMYRYRELVLICTVACIPSHLHPHMHTHLTTCSCLLQCLDVCCLSRGWLSGEGPSRTWDVPLQDHAHFPVQLGFPRLSGAQ